jgi:hypothetical protein
VTVKECQEETHASQQCTSSLDHLVGAREHRWRHFQTKRLGGLDVDNQLELRRLLNGEIAGLGAFENLVHVGGGAPNLINKVRSIGYEASGIDILPQCVGAGCLGERSGDRDVTRELSDPPTFPPTSMFSFWIIY